MSIPLQPLEKLASKTYEEYPLCPMRKKYNTEKSTIIASVDNWGEIHQHIKKNKRDEEIAKTHILYMYPTRAAQYEVTYNVKLDQWERNGKALSRGDYSFVIDKDWKMRAYSDDDETLFNEIIKMKDVAKIYFKHSTLTSGYPVHFGGMYKIQDKTWNDQSGHYRPQDPHVAACKAWHEKYGIKDSVYVEHEKTTLGKRKKSPSTDDLETISQSQQT